jgi:hypothetical protein
MMALWNQYTISAGIDAPELKLSAGSVTVEGSAAPPVVTLTCTLAAQVTPVPAVPRSAAQEDAQLLVRAM